MELEFLRLEFRIFIFWLKLEFVKLKCQNQSNLLKRFIRMYVPNFFLKSYYLANFATRKSSLLD